MVQARDVEADDFFAFGFRQAGQQHQAALAHAQRHAPADIAGMRTHRERAVHAVHADRVKAAAHQQKDGVVQHARQAQHGRAV
ncbi:hypothetical protein D3C87_1796800 [compost metagenome]